MVLFHFGWARPVPINPRNFEKPRRDFALTALAGPLSNLIMGTLSAFLYLILLRVFRSVPITSEFQFSLMQNTVSFVYIFHIVNLGIAIFNLIPVPPLDGSRLVNALLPPKIYYAIMRHERTIYFVMIGWLLLGDFAASALLSSPILASSPLIQVIAAVLDLSGIIGYAIEWLSNLIIDLFSLIPFLK
jgi:Zn-dependent protease